MPVSRPGTARGAGTRLARRNPGNLPPTAGRGPAMVQAGRIPAFPDSRKARLDGKDECRSSKDQETR